MKSLEDDDGPGGIGGPDPEEGGHWWDDYEPEICQECGRELEDSSGPGCEHCERRNPGSDASP